MVTASEIYKWKKIINKVLTSWIKCLINDTLFMQGVRWSNSLVYVSALRTNFLGTWVCAFFKTRMCRNHKSTFLIIHVTAMLLLLQYSYNPDKKLIKIEISLGLRRVQNRQSNRVTPWSRSPHHLVTCYFCAQLRSFIFCSCGFWKKQ